MSTNSEYDATPEGDDETVAVDQVVDDVRDDILHGRVDDDVSTLLDERFEEAGLEVRPEAVDDLAEDIENDVSS